MPGRRRAVPSKTRPRRQKSDGRAIRKAVEPKIACLSRHSNVQYPSSSSVAFVALPVSLPSAVPSVTSHHPQTCLLHSINTPAASPAPYIGGPVLPTLCTSCQPCALCSPTPSLSSVVHHYPNPESSPQHATVVPSLSVSIPPSPRRPHGFRLLTHPVLRTGRDGTAFVLRRLVAGAAIGLISLRNSICALGGAAASSDLCHFIPASGSCNGNKLPRMPSRSMRTRLGTRPSRRGGHPSRQPFGAGFLGGNQRVGGNNGRTGAGTCDSGGSPISQPAFLAAVASANPAPLAARSPALEKTRVLMLISDTGGGHRASAQALKAAFDELFPDAVETRIVDFWTEIAGRPFHKFPESYSFLAKNPPLWRCAWNYGRFPLTRRITEEFSNVVGNKNFRNAVEDFRPDLVVSVHPLTQFIPLRVLKTLPRKIPFVTVCTDLGGAHPTWFHPDVDLCFVPTDQVRKIALRCGLRPAQLRQYGLPVRPAFWHEDRAKIHVRADLKLLIDVPTVLIVGGGDGVGGVGRIARALADRLVGLTNPKQPANHSLLASDPARPSAQIVVVCGKNQRLRNDLASLNWPIPVHVQGFVSNMSEWMAASDILVSKAGPGTIAEALIRGLPIVLSGFLPGQEAPNVRYVTDAGVGAFSRDPATISEIVAEWLSSPDDLEMRSSRARRLGKPNATYEIVREIATLTPSLSHTTVL